MSLPVPLLAQTPRPDAYLDASAGALVAGARSGGMEANAEIEAYEMVARRHFSLGIRAFRRERLIYRQEVASRVAWTREGGRRTEVLGARMALPIARPGVRPLDDDDFASGDADLAIDPTNGDWLLRVPSFDDERDEGEDDREDGRNVENGDDEGDDAFEIVHPLAPGSEDDYRFRTGETITIRLADGRTLRLTELQVLPRRATSRLLRGSFWIDADTNAPVRGTFSLAAPFRTSLEVNWAGPLDLSLGEASMTLDYVTVEYGLWENRWWLPRLVAFEGSASAAGFTAPVVLEESYGEYRVFSAGRPFPGFEPPDTTRFRVIERRCGPETDTCPNRLVLVPHDTSLLLESDALPTAAFASGRRLIGDRELAQVASMLDASAWRGLVGRVPRFHWNPVDGGLLHYNRVEGLTLGTSGGVDLSPLAARAAVWAGTADLSPSFLVKVSRSGLDRVDRLELYRRAQAFSPADRPFSLGSSFSSFFFGRDDGDYYRSLGVALGSQLDVGTSGSLELRIHAERQTSLEKQTDVSVAHWLDDRAFRDNPPADVADQLGGEITLDLNHGLDPAGFRVGAGLSFLGETGTFRFFRPAGALYAGFPLPGSFVGAIEAMGGTSFGNLPAQRHWFVGGRGTVRGIAAGERVTGDTFWSARTEIGSELPAARLVLFGDAGWAGAQGDFELEPLLVSAGIGASFLDGLIRADVAHPLRGGGGWSLQLHLDAPL